MLVELIVSLFGIVFVHRNLSRLEKIFAISNSQLRLSFYFLQLPLYFYLFFKELFIFVLFYIGIFLITLILFDKIITYFKEKTFAELHIQLIERIILLLKTGQSATTSTKNVFSDLTPWQKMVFIDFGGITISESNSFYFQELKIILGSSGNVIEQLGAYQKALHLQNTLKLKSKLALQQTKAQAMVSLVIYAVFAILSKKYLNLQFASPIMLISVLLFCAGQLLIFKLGGKITWKT